MEISFDKTKQALNIELDETDIEDANDIREMMDSRGWKKLEDYFCLARERIIEAGKEGIKSRTKKDMSDLKFAMLCGFDIFKSTPGNIVDRAKKFIENEKAALTQQFPGGENE